MAVAAHALHKDQQLRVGGLDGCCYALGGLSPVRTSVPIAPGSLTMGLILQIRCTAEQSILSPDDEIQP